METKEKIVTLLESHQGTFLSGQTIATSLGLSRAGVWKGIKSLQEDGYEIKAVTNRGYRLLSSPDILREKGILSYMKDKNKTPKILVYDEVSSTNTLAKELIGAYGKEEFVVIAESQSQGRGRMGRSFYSPKGTGIYLSMVFHPEGDALGVLPITIGAGVGVCRTIEQFTEKKAEIKWVNDIFIDGKKVCGILTEALSDLESGTISSVILGIGINVNTLDFPEDLQGIAGSLGGESISRNAIVARLIETIMAIKENLKEPSLLEEYRKRSFLLGQEIAYEEKGRRLFGTAMNIDGDGHLVIKKEDDTFATLQWGEVSLRGTFYGQS